MRWLLLFLWLGSAFGQSVSFHHVTLVSPDPAAATRYYIRHFNAVPSPLQDFDAALKTELSYLLFERGSARPAPAGALPAIWHVGWGCSDIDSCYERRKSEGLKIHTPLSPLGDRFKYAYIESPDGVLIEINTHRFDRFGHIHLYNRDPWAAGDWYEKHFRMERRPARRFRFKNEQMDVDWKMASLMIDNVNVIIFQPPEEFEGEIVGSAGGPVDRIGFAFSDYESALNQFREAGVTVRPGREGASFRSSRITGPDGVQIEIVDGLSGP